MMRHAPRRGYVLLTALAVLGIMGVLSFAFQSAMQLDVQDANAGFWGVQARYTAASGVAEVRATLAHGGDVATLAREHDVPGGQVRVTVQDMRGQLHLNIAPVGELAALLGVPTDAISHARPFASVHDTVATLGLSPQQYTLARNTTTVHGDGGVSFDEAPLEVLTVLGGLSVSQAQAVDRHRRGPDGEAGTADDVSVNSAAGLAAVRGVDRKTARKLAKRIGADDSWLRIVAEGQAGVQSVTRRTSRIEVVLHRSATGWDVMAWLEDLPAG